jgi:hypothetical protein
MGQGRTAPASPAPGRLKSIASFGQGLDAGQQAQQQLDQLLGWRTEQSLLGKMKSSARKRFGL